MSKIEVIEVGPRDGFQSVKCAPPIATELKLKVIDKMAAAGVKHMEYTSFVSPKAIPQLADAKAVTEAVLKKYPDLDLFALVPNLRGAQNAYELGLRKVCYVVSLSKSHNKANINRTHEQSLEAYKEIRTAYPDLDVVGLANKIKPAILLWRFITYYGAILISAPFSYLTKGKRIDDAIKENELSDENELEEIKTE